MVNIDLFDNLKRVVGAMGLVGSLVRLSLLATVSFTEFKLVVKSSAAFIIKIGTLMAAIQSIYNYLPSFNQDN